MKLIFMATKTHTNHNSVFDTKIKDDIVAKDKQIVNVTTEEGDRLKAEFPLNFFDVKSDGSTTLKQPKKQKKEAPQGKDKMIKNDKKNTETKGI